MKLMITHPALTVLNKNQTHVLRAKDISIEELTAAMAPLETVVVEPVIFDGHAVFLNHFSDELEGPRDREISVIVPASSKSPLTQEQLDDYLDEVSHEALFDFGVIRNCDIIRLWLLLS